MAEKPADLSKTGWFPVESQPEHSQKLPDSDMLVLRASRSELHRLAARKAIQTIIREIQPAALYPRWAIVQTTDKSFYRFPIMEQLSEGLPHNLPGLVEVGLKSKTTFDQNIERALFAAETPDGIYLPLLAMHTEHSWVISRSYPPINTWDILDQPQLGQLPGIIT
jgi:hypothetical protein